MNTILTNSFWVIEYQLSAERGDEKKGNARTDIIPIVIRIYVLRCLFLFILVETYTWGQ